MLNETFIHYSRRKLDDYHAQIRRCVALCPLDLIWRRAGQHSNSIGNLLLHLRGNVHQWILHGLGGQTLERDRPAEFAQRDMLPIEPMMTRLAETLQAADRTIAGLSVDDLSRSYTIQSYQVTGLEAVYHVVEHLGFHTGQIITMTKAMLDVDLSLYDVQGHRLDVPPGGPP